MGVSKRLWMEAQEQQAFEELWDEENWVDDEYSDDEEIYFGDMIYGSNMPMFDVVARAQYLGYPPDLLAAHGSKPGWYVKLLGFEGDPSRRLRHGVMRNVFVYWADDELDEAIHEYFRDRNILLSPDLIE